MRRHRQSVTMIVTTKATSTTSWTTTSAPMSHPFRGRKGGGRRTRRTPPFPLFRCRVPSLGQVVADVAEDVLDLPAQEDHGDDHGDGNDSDDEGIFDHALTVVLAEEALDLHGVPLSRTHCRYMPRPRQLGHRSRPVRP